MSEVRLGIGEPSNYPRGLMASRPVCRLFAWVWRRWLWDAYYKTHGTVLHVRGWRTALVEYNTRRMTVTACFWWFK